MALDIPLRKTNTGQQASSFYGTKIWTKISDTTKNLKIVTFSQCSEEIHFKQTVLVNNLV